MKDKKQDEISLEELVKAANAIRDFFTKLGDELSKVLANIKVLKEDTWEMKCPYEFGDEYWNIIWGKVRKNTWDWIDCERTSFEAGEIFPTQQEAELELKRRNLLTRFRSFRDECNEDWKADWTNAWDCKFFVSIIESELEVKPVYIANDFVLFGYFKNPKDAERAIELFGDEIIELFVEGE
ncbi:hypothetical protein [Granulicatella adiacens]|uniref:hypothetical protein n=1 Tax=Granulicatella adiacens TaxID=46124 RepID=UPI001C3C6202|nr:hypothetical protein [Granulicatella adiacens]